MRCAVHLLTCSLFACSLSLVACGDGELDPEIVTNLPPGNAKHLLPRHL